MFYISIIISTEFGFYCDIFFLYTFDQFILLIWFPRLFNGDLFSPLGTRLSVIRTGLFKKITIQIFITGIFNPKISRIQLHIHTMLHYIKLHIYTMIVYVCIRLLIIIDLR